MSGKDSREKLVSLARCAAVLNAERDPARSLELVCNAALALFGLQSAIFWERDGSDLVAVSVEGNQAPKIRGLRVPIDSDVVLSCRCLRERAPILEQNVPEIIVGPPPGIRVEPAASVLCVPLIHQEEVLGVICLRDCDKADRFTLEDLEAITIFAGMAAVAMTNARLSKEMEKRAREAMVLSEIGRIASSAMDMGEKSEAFAQKLRDLVAFDRVALALIEDGDKVRRILVAGDAAGKYGHDTIGPLEGHGLQWLVRNRRTLVIPDIEKTQAFTSDHYFISNGLRSSVRVPLIDAGEVLGSLNLWSRVPNAFGSREVELLEQVAGQIAGTFAYAQLIGTQRLILNRLYSLHRITDAALSTLDLNSLLESLLDRCIEIVGADGGAVLLLDEDGKDLIIKGARWIEGETPWDYRRKLGEGVAGKVALEGRPRLIQEVDQENPADVGVSRARGVHSILAVPLLAREKTLGVLRLDSLQPGRFDRQHLQMIEVAAERMALAVESARLYGQTDEKLRARVRELGSLVRLGRAVSEQLSPNLVMRRAVEEGGRALDADRCSIFIVDMDTRAFIVGEDYDRENGFGIDVGTRLWLEQHPDSLEAFLLKEPRILKVDDPLIPETEKARLQHLGIATSIMLPLAAGEKLVGIAFFGRRIGRADFSEEDLALARAVAGQVAVALENARLFQEVQKQKSRTEALLSSMSEGVYATDADRCISAVNPWLELMLGHRASDMVGRPCREVLHHTDEEGTLLCDRACPLEEVFTNGKPFEPTMMFAQTAWGDRLPTLVSIAPIRNELGETVGAVSVSRDVTREWQMDKLKSNIISVVSHEFRTPLTSVLGFSEFLMMRERPKKERRRCLELIHQEALRLETLVNDFLDVSKLEAGKITLDLQPLDPGQALESAVAAMAARTGQHQLVSEIESHLPQVEVDPERLEQILSNLLSNAIKYSPHGTPIIVRARVASPDTDNHLLIGKKGKDRWVVFTVEDRGVGIPSDQIHNIFRPFHRIEGDFTRRIRGTGLGLSIVKSLVELHSGRLWVESEVGVGSKFHVAFLAMSGMEL